MVRFFKDKANTSFVIDYAKSLETLRSHQAVLNYIANLKLKVDKLENCEVTGELVHAFSVMRDKCDVDPLNRILANVLYFCKYGEILYETSFNDFGFEAIVDYVTKFGNTVVIQSAFLNSLPLFSITSAGSDENSDRIQHPLVNTVDRVVHSEISTNLFNLFSLDHFLIHYLEQATPIADQIYFEPHFDRNMYQGKSLFGWYGIAQNTYFLLCKHITDSAMNAEGRIQLVDLYAELLQGTARISELKQLSDNIENAGGIHKYVKATRKEVAALKRNAKKLKKRNARVPA